MSEAFEAAEESDEYKYNWMGQVKAGDVVLELQRFVVVAAEISGMTLEVAEGEGSRVLVHGEKVRLGKMEHSIELVREKNRAALVSFY